MIVSMREIYFPIKRLKDVLPREVFSFHPTGRPYVRVSMVSDFTKFMLLSLDHDDCHYPKEEEMDKQVYMLKATVKITMCERKKES